VEAAGPRAIDVMTGFGTRRMQREEQGRHVKGQANRARPSNCPTRPISKTFSAPSLLVGSTVASFLGYTVGETRRVQSLAPICKMWVVDCVRQVALLYCRRGDFDYENIITQSRRMKQTGSVRFASMQSRECSE